MLDSCFRKENFILPLNPLTGLELKGGKEITFLLASAPGEQAIESQKLRSGLATYVLLDHLKRSITSNRTGAIDFDKVFTYTAIETPALAKSLHGQSQHPVVTYSHQEITAPSEGSEQ